MHGADVVSAEKCTTLTAVCFDGCKDLTDAGLIALAEICATLSGISVRGCTRISDAAKPAVKEQRPDVHIE